MSEKEIAKAIPLYASSVKLTVSYDIPDAWECWTIIVTDPPKDQAINSQWLSDNPMKWEYEDFLDRGGDQLTNLQIEN